MITLFAFASPSTVIVMSFVVSVLFAIPVKYLSVAITSAVTFWLALSMLMFSTFHIGSTTSTITPSLFSSVFGSSTPIVIVLSMLKLPLLSTIPDLREPSAFSSPALNANFIIPL